MTATLDLARMRELWDGSPELSARQIGELCGVTKNVVIGRADRGKWKPRKIERPNIYTRLAAVHARMDAVLAATQAVLDAGGRRLVTMDVVL